MIQIPLKSIPNQTFSITLNSQDCTITLVTRNDNLYCSLIVNNEIIFMNILCRDRSSLKLYKHMNFNGHILFVDTNVNSYNDPYYVELGSRYKMYYLDDLEIKNVNL